GGSWVGPVDGRRSARQVEVVVATAVARHLLDAHRVGDHGAVSQVGQLDRQAGAVGQVGAQSAPAEAAIAKLVGGETLGALEHGGWRVAVQDGEGGVIGE